MLGHEPGGLFYTGPEMIECPNCGKQMSNQAVTCGQCFQPMQQKDYNRGIEFENGYARPLEIESRGIGAAFSKLFNNLITTGFVVLVILGAIVYFAYLGHH